MDCDFNHEDSPSRDRQGAEPACYQRAALNHRGSRSVTVAARVVLNLTQTVMF
jgi:hypothetical protein